FFDVAHFSFPITESSLKCDDVRSLFELKKVASVSMLVKPQIFVFSKKSAIFLTNIMQIGDNLLSLSTN
ncbi:MAG: hypothetical protein ACPHV3_09390, partial [Vibrio sp.]